MPRALVLVPAIANRCNLFVINTFRRRLQRVVSLCDRFFCKVLWNNTLRAREAFNTLL